MDPVRASSVASKPGPWDSLRTIADYQFGRGAGAALFPPDNLPSVQRSSSGRPTQLHAEDGRLVTLGQDGRFTLGFAGGRRLREALSAPSYRVAIDDESLPFVSEGANTFARFVRKADSTIRPHDEVLVVHEENDRLLAVGRAELSGEAILDFETGVAVSVREGRAEWADRD